MNIDEMQSGREINELIAVHVMGLIHYVGDEVPSGHAHYYLKPEEIPEVWLKELPNRDFERYCKQCGDMPDWSGDIAAAWEVVEKMRENGWHTRIDVLLEGRYMAEIYCNYGPCEKHGNGTRSWHGGEAEANSTPLAICRASLKALGA